jgi:hypothetical protein
LLSDPLTTPINRPPRDSPGRNPVYLLLLIVVDTFATHLLLTHLHIFPVFEIE